MKALRLIALSAMFCLTASVGAKPARHTASPSVTAASSAAQSPTPRASQPASQTSVVLKVDSIAPIIIATEPAKWYVTYGPMLASVFSSVLALAGVLGTLHMTSRNATKSTAASHKISDASIWQKANETELKDIQARLDGFFMPYTLLSNANETIATDLRARQPAGYRLLMYLFDTDWRAALSEGDRKIVEIICCNAEHLRDIIANKSGLVSGEVLEYLTRASVHYRILNLAYKNELGTDKTRFAKYVYPRQLDEVLKLEIERLNERARQLRLKPSERPDPAPVLIIPPHLKLDPL